MAHKLTFDQLSTEDAMAIADGLMEAERFEAAAQILRILLREKSPASRTRLNVRAGLASVPNARATLHYDVLKVLEKGVAEAFVGEALATWNKTLPFYDDPRFVELADKHSHLLPLPNWHWNLQTVLWAVRRAKMLEGDLVELGVFKGHTTLFCADYVEFAGWPKRWFLYDTFEGIPDDQLDPGWAQLNTEVYKGAFSFEEVRDRFAAFPNIEVVKGRVPEVLVGSAPERIAFLHVDLNNSAAEIAALDTLYDRVVPGGVIVFDDYGWMAARAQHDAENAWFAARGLQILPLPTGQGFFVKP